MSISNIRLRVVLILGVFMSSWLAVLPASHALEIRVKERATVQGDTIHLGDIASFDPIKDSRVAELSKIEVASAPSPGNSFRLNAHFLVYKIGSAIAGKDDIRIKTPENLLVQRAAQFISADRLEEIFKEHIRSHLPWPPEKIVFERIRTPATIALPVGKLHWEVREKGNQRYVGNIALALKLFVDGRQIRKVPLSGKISVKQEVVKAAMKIKKGQLIFRDDLILITESSAHIRRNTLTRLDEAVGKRSVRSIQAGQLITSQMVEDPPLVKKGDRVVIKAENEQLRITTLGLVLEDGRSGDQVKVMNISSKKEIFATVMGPKLVEVSF